MMTQTSYKYDQDLQTYVHVLPYSVHVFDRWPTILMDPEIFIQL